MSGAAKGMAGLVVALALIGGLAFWLLKDDGGGHGILGERRAAANSDPNAPVGAAAANGADGAKRAMEEKPVAAESAESAEGKLPPGTPTAEYLAGLVVDHEGRPVAGAEVSFAAQTFTPRTRGRGGRRMQLSFAPTGPEIPATTAKTNADGTFRLTHVPRLDNFDLTVDHPDFVYLRRSGVVVPARGMDVGRLTLEPGGAVSGQVFGPGGAKVANAEVWLEDVQDDNNPFRFFNFGAPARGERKTVSDEQGRFRLTGMPAGKCTAAAKTEDYPEGASPQLEVKLGEESANVVVHLEAGDRLTGVVKGSDRKLVVDAEIHVNQNNRGMSFSFGGRRMPFEPAAKSDADGHFEVKALKRGVYEVSVVAKAYAIKTVAEVDTSAGAPLEITLTSGTHVAGMVRLKDTQEPAKNVKVQLQKVFGEQAMPTSLDFPPDSDNAATQDGAFVIAEVDPGTYRVVARGDDTTRGTSPNFEVVEGQSLENIEVVVERGAVVEGRVVDATTGAPVANVDVEASATPQEGASSSGPGGQTVRVQGFFGGPGGRRVFAGGNSRQPVARSKSDASGHFELKSISAGSIQIDTRHADYATTRSAPLELKAGEHKSGLDLPIGRGGAIEGAVTGLDGKPRAGDRIDVVSKTIEGVALHAVTDGDGLYHVDHVPAGDGVVERSEADGGDNRRPNFRGSIVVADGSEADPGKPFSLKEGDTVRVDFTQQEKPYVEGVVRSASGPVAGVTVSASQQGGGRRGFVFGGGGKTATTADDGSYRLADLEPGSYRISARHPESIVPLRENVELKSGEPARVDFFLEGGVIEGDVFAQKNHAKLEGAVVTLARVEGDAANGGGGTADVAFTFAVQTTGGRGRGGRGTQTLRFGDDMNQTQVASDATGHFRVPWVPAGKWKVTVNHPGFLEATSEDVVVAANAHVEGVKLELGAAAQLVVHLKSKGTGQALPNAPVELTTEDGGHNYGVTDETGEAHFDSLKPGTWTVTGRKSFGSPGGGGANDGQKKTVEAPADRTTEITIDV